MQTLFLQLDCTKMQAHARMCYKSVQTLRNQAVSENIRWHSWGVVAYYTVVPRLWYFALLGLSAPGGNEPILCYTITERPSSKCRVLLTLWSHHSTMHRRVECRECSPSTPTARHNPCQSYLKRLEALRIRNASIAIKNDRSPFHP